MSTRSLSLAILGILACGAQAHAHALGASFRIDRDKGRVHLEAFFDDDTPAANALITVLDADKQTVAKGKTDATGSWSFRCPPQGHYRVTVEAGDGHRAIKKLVISDATVDSAQDKQHHAETTPSRDALRKGDSPPQGDDRKEFTRFPWLGLGVGLGVIGFFSLAYLASRRRPSKPGGKKNLDQSGL